MIEIQNYVKQYRNQLAKKRLQRDTFVLIIIIIKTDFLGVIINCWWKWGNFLMRTWDVDVVVTFAERVMSGNTLRASHKKFPGTGISQTCKGKEEFKVTIAEAGEV